MVILVGVLAIGSFLVLRWMLTWRQQVQRLLFNANCSSEVLVPGAKVKKKRNGRPQGHKKKKGKTRTIHGHQRQNKRDHVQIESPSNIQPAVSSVRSPSTPQGPGGHLWYIDPEVQKGLRNPKDTDCYACSTIQAIASLANFNATLRRKDVVRSMLQPQRGDLSYQHLLHFSLSRGHSGTIGVSKILESVNSGGCTDSNRPGFGQGHEEDAWEDAQEFLYYLLATVAKEEQQLGTTAGPTQQLRGKIETAYKCVGGCKDGENMPIFFKEEEESEVIHQVKLDLESVSTQVDSLSDAIQKDLQLEPRKVRICPCCSRLMERASIKWSLLPNDLILHCPRHMFDLKEQAATLMDTEVTVPAVLDPTTFTTSDAQNLPLVGTDEVVENLDDDQVESIRSLYSQGQGRFKPASEARVHNKAGNTWSSLENSTTNLHSGCREELKHKRRYYLRAVVNQTNNVVNGQLRRHYYTDLCQASGSVPPQTGGALPVWKNCDNDGKFSLKEQADVLRDASTTGYLLFYSLMQIPVEGKA